MGELADVPEIAFIADHYDSLDFFYRDIWGVHVHHGLWMRGDESPEEAAAALSHMVVDRLQLEDGMLLVDIGCGYGGTSRIAVERHAVDAVGFTVSKAQKAFADQQVVRNGTVEIICQDWMQAPLSAESFDAALSLESIEHMPSRIEFLARVRRVLKPGGRLVLGTWLAAENPSAWSTRHLLVPISTEGRQARLITAKALSELLRSSGFTEVIEEDLTQNVKRTWSVVLWRLLSKVLTRPRYWRLLVNSKPSDRVFAVTSLRIWAAYRIGAMRYAVYTCR